MIFLLIKIPWVTFSYHEFPSFSGWKPACGQDVAELSLVCSAHEDFFPPVFFFRRAVRGCWDYWDSMIEVGNPTGLNLIEPDPWISLPWGNSTSWNVWIAPVGPTMESLVVGDSPNPKGDLLGRQHPKGEPKHWVTFEGAPIVSPNGWFFIGDTWQKASIFLGSITIPSGCD